MHVSQNGTIFHEADGQPDGLPSHSPRRSRESIPIPSLPGVAGQQRSERSRTSSAARGCWRQQQLPAPPLPHGSRAAGGAAAPPGGSSAAQPGPRGSAAAPARDRCCRACPRDRTGRQGERGKPSALRDLFSPGGGFATRSFLGAGMDSKLRAAAAGRATMIQSEACAGCDVTYWAAYNSFTRSWSRKEYSFHPIFSGSGLHLNNSTLKSIWVSATHLKHRTTLKLKFIPGQSSYLEAVIMPFSMLKYEYGPQEEEKRQP